MITVPQQLQLVCAYVDEVNEKHGYPLVYAGHEMCEEGMRVRLFSLRETPNAEPLYATVKLSWQQVSTQMARYGI